MLQEVQPSRKGFEDLQLKDNDHKKSIEALVKTHLSHKLKKETDRVHDLVAGKGQSTPILWNPHTGQEGAFTEYQFIGEGLIILLHGSPGVGKTSTAGECRRKSSVIRLCRLTKLCRMYGRLHCETAASNYIR